jgi:hypothetical protein
MNDANGIGRRGDGDDADSLAPRRDGRIDDLGRVGQRPGEGNRPSGFGPQRASDGVECVTREDDDGGAHVLDVVPSRIWRRPSWGRERVQEVRVRREPATDERGEAAGVKERDNRQRVDDDDPEMPPPESMDLHGDDLPAAVPCPSRSERRAKGGRAVFPEKSLDERSLRRHLVLVWRAHGMG